MRAPWISLTLVILVDFDDFRVRVPWISFTLVILVDFDDFHVYAPCISLTLMIFNDFCDFCVRAPWISLTFVILVDFDDFRVRAPWIALTLDGILLRGVGPRGLVHDGVFVVRELVHALHEFLFVPLVFPCTCALDFVNSRGRGCRLELGKPLLKDRE